jgi:hypothetical protein
MKQYQYGDKVKINPHYHQKFWQKALRTPGKLFFIVWPNPIEAQIATIDKNGKMTGFRYYVPTKYLMPDRVFKLEDFL